MMIYLSVYSIIDPSKRKKGGNVKFHASEVRVCTAPDSERKGKNYESNRYYKKDR